MKKFKDLMQLFLAFLKIGAFTFGGGYAMIPMIEREVVDKHGWIKKEDIADIVVIAESTPGPIAVNAATFVGYRHLGFWGSFFATLGVALPSFILILLIALAFGFVKDNKWVEAAFLGIRAGVTALLAGVVIRLFKTLDKSLIVFAVFLIAFLLATFIKIDVIFIILAGGIFGLSWQALRARKQPQKIDEHTETEEESGDDLP